jgi:hypothetical protein
MMHIHKLNAGKDELKSMQYSFGKSINICMHINTGWLYMEIK